MLFNPTQTISERHEVLQHCKQYGPSAEFSVKYPELAGMIKQMTSENPAFRPSIAEIKKTRLFAGIESGASEWDKLGVNGKKNLIKIGSNGKCKTKFVKVFSNNLLVYNHKGDEKAKFCYPLQECKIITQRNTPSSTKPIKRNKSSYALEENMVPLDSCYRVSIEHPQLETLYLFVQNVPLCPVSY